VKFKPTDCVTVSVVVTRAERDRLRRLARLRSVNLGQLIVELVAEEMGRRAKA
jgi:hypothetical protein